MEVDDGKQRVCLHEPQTGGSIKPGTRELLARR